MFLIINKITCTTNLNLTSMDDREYNVESNQPHGIEITPVSERVATVKHNSNLLIEDRYTTRQLKNFNGYFLAVLDGHGGAQLAEFANSQLADWFDINYLATKAKFYDEDESVVQALKLTFLQIEQAYLKIAKKKFQLGDGISSTAGSCVTAVLVSQKKIYSAQLGDSKARIFTKINNFYIGRKITTTHNCKTKNEMDRLKTEFPNEQDIVVCKFNKVCYVKGRLQPTRVRKLI